MLTHYRLFFTMKEAQRSPSKQALRRWRLRPAEKGDRKRKKHDKQPDKDKYAGDGKVRRPEERDPTRA